MSLAKSAIRSRRAKNLTSSSGPQGWHHNPQDFSELVGQQIGSRQEFYRANWHYLPDELRAKGDALSTSYKGVPVEKNGQFALAL